MIHKKQPIDLMFLGIASVLLVGGYFIFTSASFGLLLTQEGAFASTAFTQLVSIIIGLLGCFFAVRFPLGALKKWSPFIAGVGALVMVLVLVPGIGVAHGGAQRWFSFHGVSVQPGELFKLAFILALAAWLAGERRQERGGARPFLILSGFLAAGGALFLLQPDTDSFAILFIAACVMYRVAGYPWRHLLLLGTVALIGAALLFSFRPYLLERLTVFINPDRDSLGAGYQLQQSLIAIGSGGLFGKGFGKSIQKFERLPEPTSDSIFAVFGEEFGLFGTSILLLLFVALTLKGLRIAARAPDMFGGLVALGVMLLIAGAAFVNFASMLGLIPLSGLTLPFISRGGTAMFATLIEVGLILNVSRQTR